MRSHNDFFNVFIYSYPVAETSLHTPNSAYLEILECWKIIIVQMINLDATR